MDNASRVTGAWIKLLAEWLDQEELPAPGIRDALRQWRLRDIVPIDVWESLLQQAVLLRPDRPALGLAIGSRAKAKHFGILGYLIYASDTIEQALVMYQRYERILSGTDFFHISVDSSEQEVEISWPGKSLLVDSVDISAFVALIRSLIAAEINLHRVSFCGNGPVDACVSAAFEEHFQCQVQFGDVRTRIWFSSIYLMEPLINSDPGLIGILSRQAEEMLVEAFSSSEFERNLFGIVMKLLAEQRATVESAADSLYMSKRTLQRRLAESGITWQHVLDLARERLARRYLADPSLALGDIAMLIGFSEQSSFNRAIKRWTGKTPLEIRRQSCVGES
ncbi:helix-turn-helix domain-containing protein [Burkholderia pyrrocinia]|uniref:helix-turn-helix domain-containing protein n=1 Tax=Burkholderia pyrrocinia TaxID=60550 RepID=UPI002AB14989|nr:AraC family transcriptional regulator ligand-binding domain-containing protein [Burkholderia pyrrocinia]